MEFLIKIKMQQKINLYDIKQVNAFDLKTITHYAKGWQQYPYQWVPANKIHNGHGWIPIKVSACKLNRYSLYPQVNRAEKSIQIPVPASTVSTKELENPLYLYIC